MCWKKDGCNIILAMCVLEVDLHCIIVLCMMGIGKGAS